MKARKILSLVLALILVTAGALTVGILSVSAEATGISSADELASITDGDYKLTQNITLTGTIPAFSGTLDGNGYTVTVSAPMFDALTGTVKNLKLAGEITVASTKVTGALANTATGATVENCTSSVTITGTPNNDYLRVGGFVGEASGTTVSKSTFDGSISLTGLLHKENDNGIGGIVGHISASTTVSECVNKGAITTTGAASSNRGGQGGIVGFSENSTITKCLNNADIKADTSAFCVGGIVGRTQPNSGSPTDVTYCANYGAVTKANSGGELAGGIAGFFKQGNLLYCYNVGTISNNNGKCGGIFGYINAQHHDLTLSYNYNVGSCVHGIGYAKNDTDITSEKNYYLASAASDGSAFGADIKGLFTAEAVADAAALNAAVLAIDATPFVVDPALNNGYAVLAWQCSHSETKVDCVGTKCTICGVHLDESGAHSGEWTVTSEATAVTDGSKKRTCTVCGEEEVLVIDATGKIAPDDNTYNVETAEQMEWLAYNMNNGTVSANANVTLKADITLTNGMSFIDQTYTGTFDGEGHTLAGLNYTIFNSLKGTVKNIVFKGDIDYTALSDNNRKRKAATVSFEASNATVENVTSYVNIKSSANDLNAGAIIGYSGAGGCTFKNVQYAGTYEMEWTGNGGGWGGIIGWVNNTNSFTNCSFSGTATITGDAPNGNFYAGGIVGNGSGTFTLTGCSNAGTININITDETVFKAAYVGGLAGNLGGSFSLNDCVVTGTTSKDGKDNYGAFVGKADRHLNNISGCITLTVSTVENNANFIGNGNKDAIFVDCFTSSNSYAIGEAFTYNGKEYQKYNFGYLDVATGQLVAASSIVDPNAAPAYSGGTIFGSGTTYTIASDDFSAFLSRRKNSDGISDYRIILAADLAGLDNYDQLYMKVTFLNGTDEVRSWTYNVAKELYVYKSALAAGITYTAEEGSVLFGRIITGVPDNAWTNLTVTLIDENDTEVVSGGTRAGRFVPATPICLNTYTNGAAALLSSPFECHTIDNVNKMYAVFNFNSCDYLNSLLQSQLGKENGSVYAVVTIDGTAYRITNISTVGGYTRLNIQDAGAVIYSGCAYSLKVEFFSAMGDLLYYFSEATYTSGQTTPGAPAREKMNTTLPEGLTTLTEDTTSFKTENIGHWGDGNVERFFDNNHTGTKLGGNVSDTSKPVVVYFNLTDAASVSYITFYTGGDTATNTGRNPLGFVLYGKVNGEWVELVNICDNKTHTTGFEPVNSTPFHYAITNVQECTEYKLDIIPGGGQMQLNEMYLYEG